MRTQLSAPPSRHLVTSSRAATAIPSRSPSRHRPRPPTRQILSAAASPPAVSGVSGYRVPVTGSAVLTTGAKPRLRGVLHEWGFYVAIPLGITLGLVEETTRARVA